MDKIDVLLSRGVDKIYPSRESLEKVLRSGKKLRLYQGFDPSGTKLHIGHAVGFRKHRQFQDLGHEVIFLIGDGTGQAGDPSGKHTTREKFFTRDELRANAVDYLAQAAKIVRFEGQNPIKILYNGDWLNELKLIDILNIAGHFSLQRLAERDMFVERMKKGETVNLREFLYPLLQAYDSVAMNVDLELGGSDQTFNMLCGRTLVKEMLGKEKFVMTTPLLTDSKGVKIGKSEGNVIGITDPPEDFFGKIMALSDDVIGPGFTLLTDTVLEEIAEMQRKMDKGEENPMMFKKRLAFELTKQFNNETAAVSAQKAFEQVFQKGDVAKSDIPIFKTSQPDWNPVDLLVATKFTSSKSEAKRLMEQGGMEVNKSTIRSAKDPIRLKNGDILKVGKRKFLKIVIR